MLTRWPGKLAVSCHLICKATVTRALINVEQHMQGLVVRFDDQGATLSDGIPPEQNLLLANTKDGLTRPSIGVAQVNAHHPNEHTSALRIARMRQRGGAVDGRRGGRQARGERSGARRGHAQMADPEVRRTKKIVWFT
jgi:hypothetical protein